ncbi:unnamed protein product [Pleuronectes platessa]|uniref:Uncharacterized protein n=1 Tax=Pleuronectes platessa TaxID=8262 RepID=A0A9N7V1K3_PLEPL|nr:unnamed protein product [Pleuronectes platessa]
MKDEEITDSDRPTADTTGAMAIGSTREPGLVSRGRFTTYQGTWFSALRPRPSLQTLTEQREKNMEGEPPLRRTSPRENLSSGEPLIGRTSPQENLSSGAGDEQTHWTMKNRRAQIFTNQMQREPISPPISEFIVLYTTTLFS